MEQEPQWPGKENDARDRFPKLSRMKMEVGT